MRRFPLIFIIIFVAATCLCTMSEAETSTEGLYKVGIKDIIDITVIGHKDLSVSTQVAIDGTIAFPHLGTIYVKDKTLPAIEKEITDKLSEGYVKYPVVSVSLVRAESKRIFINGEVLKNGIIPFEKDMTVIQAISIAGGISPNGLYGKVKLRRKQKGSAYTTVFEVDVENGIITDNKIEDMLLQPDDIIFVESSKTFFIQGYVTKTGRYILESGMTVSRALTISGGIIEGGLHGKVIVRRKEEGGSGYEQLIESTLDNGSMTSSEMEDMLLQADDILKIERSETFFIEGEVAAPARYTLEYGMTVGRAITVAGGITEGGMYGKVKVRRKREGESGYEDIEIDLEGIIEGSETGDMILQPDDILIVERNKTYIVYGEVNRIGEFPLSTDSSVFKAILQAGGFNKWGKENRVKVLRLTEDGQGFVTIKVDINDVLDGDAEADILLQPGDVVVVSSGIF